MQVSMKFYISNKIGVDVQSMKLYISNKIDVDFQNRFVLIAKPCRYTATYIFIYLHGKITV